MPRSIKVLSPFKCKDNKHFLEIITHQDQSHLSKHNLFACCIHHMVVDTKMYPHNVEFIFYSEVSMYSLFHVCSCIILYFFCIFIAISNVIFCMCGLHRNFKIFWTATIFIYYIVTIELIILR